ESMRRGLSVVVTSMLPAFSTDSWLASEAHRRQIRRARWSLHSTSRPRRGEAQCRRAELSIGGLRRRAPDAAGPDAWPACCCSSSSRLRSIKRTERCERRLTHSDIRAGKIQISVEEISLRHQRESDANQWRWIYGVCNK